MQCNAAQCNRGSQLYVCYHGLNGSCADSRLFLGMFYSEPVLRLTSVRASHSRCRETKFSRLLLLIGLMGLRGEGGGTTHTGDDQIALIITGDETEGESVWSDQD